MYTSRTAVITLWDILADLAQARGDNALAARRRLNADTQRWLRDGAGHAQYG